MPGTRWDLEAAGIECDGKGQGTEAVQPLATGGDPWRRRRQMYSLFPSRLGAVAHTGGERRFHYSGVFSLVFAQNTLGFEGSPAVPRRRQATLIFLFFIFFPFGSCMCLTPGAPLTSLLLQLLLLTCVYAIRVLHYRRGGVKFNGFKRKC